MLRAPGARVALGLGIGSVWRKDVVDKTGAAGVETMETVEAGVFDPDEVRPWRFHNRISTGLDDASLEELATSIRRDGQQQLGLARRLPSGGTHAVEAVFGVRRLEACRRAGVPWRARVLDASVPDTQCAALMYGENEWTEGVSPLENALRWKEMLDAGVFGSQSKLADDIGCHRGTVSRAVRTATTLFGEEWIDRLVRPVMHDFTGRSADRLADALVESGRRQQARRRAEELTPGTVPAAELYDALLGARRAAAARQTVFVRRRGRGGGGGMVAAKLERDGHGGFTVSVRPHEQTAADLAELAEQIEALVAAETAAAAGVRFGRRLVGLLTPEEARNADRAWLEGYVGAMARASGLDWDRWRCAATADVLRSQPDGWERAVVRAVGGRGADLAGN